MSLATRYLGLELAHPFMPGASPLADDLDLVRRLEDAGAAAIVMHSLFEEQLAGEQVSTHLHLERPAESYAEALDYLPEPDGFALGPEQYLEQLQRIKAAVTVPVIASLNGTSRGGWLGFARQLAAAGADALELNLYRLPTSVERSAEDLEAEAAEMVADVVRGAGVPVAVKLSPFYTSLPHFARRLERAGAAGLVLFNRFYQPDIDPEALVAARVLHLSEPTDLLLRLRWLAILRGKVGLSLAATGGVHGPLDAIKALMAGADAVQMVSTLLRGGPEKLAMVRRGVEEWMAEHEYGSIDELRGSMSFEHAPDPAAYERANYIEILRSWMGTPS